MCLAVITKPIVVSLFSTCKLLKKTNIIRIKWKLPFRNCNYVMCVHIRCRACNRELQDGCFVLPPSTSEGQWWGNKLPAPGLRAAREGRVTCRDLSISSKCSSPLSMPYFRNDLLCLLLQPYSMLQQLQKFWNYTFFRTTTSEANRNHEFAWSATVDKSLTWLVLISYV